MRSFLAIIDAGHGGLKKVGKDLVYQTDGKRAFYPNKKLHDGGNYYEGVSNRKFADMLAAELDKLKIPFVFLHDSIEDTPLAVRVKKANALAKNYDASFLISLHSNWVDNPKVRGFSVWTTKGQTISDRLATFLFNQIGINIPKTNRLKDMADNDPDFEEQFYILKYSSMPAILSEYLFYSNPDDVELIVNNPEQDALYVKCLVKTILEAKNTL